MSNTSTSATESHFPRVDTITFSQPEAFSWDGQNIGEKLSIINMFKVLAGYMSSYESALASGVDSIKGTNASNIDQGTLLELQAMVQTWSTVSGTATGILRSVGDVLMKITQNIR